MEDWRERTELQIGKEGVQKLENASVAIIGLGGVGAFAAEMLCRAGVGSFILADSDVIDITNKNRQLPALDSTIGRIKTEVIAERMKDINKDVKVKIISTYIEEDNLSAKLKLRRKGSASEGDKAACGNVGASDGAAEGDKAACGNVAASGSAAEGDKAACGNVAASESMAEGGKAACGNVGAEEWNEVDFVVDAIDTLSPKIALIQYCLQNKIPMVSSMGAGAKYDATKVRIAEIEKSFNCPLAYMLRKRLHKVGIRKGFKVVFSEEIPDKEAIIPCEGKNKKSRTGTLSYMPAVFGCVCAQAAIQHILSVDV
jgi:tRNA A37 threonylcarbamoyladenosine dehydratase